MHTHNLLIDKCTNRHNIKNVRKQLPKLEIILSFAFVNKNLTFVIKSINSIDTRALVIASEQEEILGEFDFIGENQRNALD